VSAMPHRLVYRFHHSALVVAPKLIAALSVPTVPAKTAATAASCGPLIC
jgi:hypothetical protein